MLYKVPVETSEFTCIHQNCPASTSFSSKQIVRKLIFFHCILYPNFSIKSGDRRKLAHGNILFSAPSVTSGINSHLNNTNICFCFCLSSWPRRPPICDETKWCPFKFQVCSFLSRNINTMEAWCSWWVPFKFPVEPTSKSDFNAHPHTKSSNNTIFDQCQLSTTFVRVVSRRPNTFKSLTPFCCYPTSDLSIACQLEVHFLPFLEEHTTTCLAGPTLAQFRWAGKAILIFSSLEVFEHIEFRSLLRVIFTGGGPLTAT